MKKIITLILLTVSFFGLAQQKTIDQKVNTLLKKMTIEEKIGQLNVVGTKYIRQYQELAMQCHLNGLI